MRDKYGVKPDRYCYPDSTVLINRLNILDEALLEKAETEFSSARAAEYQPTFELFDLNHFQAVHYQLFQDIYDWAGKIREVDISKNETRFCTAGRIEAEATKLLSGLAKENHLRGLDRKQFVERAAHYYCELNVIHPFRDGNGRAQRLFFEELALSAEYELSWTGIERAEWLAANIAGFHDDLLPLIKLFEGITTSL